MADSLPGMYLIAYDIADPKRLARVHRVLKKDGLPIQYSVFTVVMKRPPFTSFVGACRRTHRAEGRRRALLPAA